MTAAPVSPEAGFAKKLGTAAFRPPPARRGPTAGQRAVRALFWGVVLVAAGFGVVHYRQSGGAGASVVRDVRSSGITMAFAVPQDSVLKYRTRMDVKLHREEVPSAFDHAMMTIFDLRQVANHDHEVMQVGSRRGGTMLDVRSECRLEQQSGTWEEKDGSVRPIYPWRDWIDVQRVHVSADGPMRGDDGEPLPGRDVPPLLTFAHVGGRVGDLEPGARWSARALLPCLAAPSGALAPSAFDCDLTFVGRRVLEGLDCAVVKLSARPRNDLDDRFDHLNAAGGGVKGALAYDAATGLLVRADLEIDAHVRHAGEGPDARVTVKGRLLVTRRQ
jgi:hypothetical protein